MLPLELSAGACSLRPGEVRRVVSVEVRIGADGTPGAPHVRRALIRSRARLSYDEAQEVLAGAGSIPRATCSRARTRWRAICALGATPAAPSRWRRASSRSRSTTAASRAPAGTRSRAPTRSSRSSCCSRTRRSAACSRARGARALPRPRASAARGAAGAGRPPDRLGLPVVPLPERADGPAASRAVARQAELLEPILRERPATREAFGTLLLRTLQVARYDPVNSGHAALASPRTCTSPRRSGAIPTSWCIARPARWRASARTRRRRASCPSSRLRCSQREREAADAERRADAICLAFLLRDRLRRDGWHADVRGRRHGPHRRRAVRALRRCLRGLPAGEAARSPRALRQRRARRCARRTRARAGASASATSSPASSRRSTRRAGGRRSTWCPRTTPPRTRRAPPSARRRAARPSRQKRSAAPRRKRT